MKTIEKTIQHPERYEAPGVKVKVLRKRAMMIATSADEFNANVGQLGDNEEE